jgi:hypothetical protein
VNTLHLRDREIDLPGRARTHESNPLTHDRREPVRHRVALVNRLELVQYPSRLADHTLAADLVLIDPKVRVAKAEDALVTIEVRCQRRDLRSLLLID